jgi:chromosome segregation ATPase
MGQAEEALATSRETQQDHLSRLLVLETLSSKFEQQIGELQTVRQQLVAQQEELLESQRRADRDRTQAMTGWGRKLEEYAHQMEVWTEQLRFFADQQEKMRHVSREVQELAHQVSQQQDQLRQTQRIAGEQLRNEFKEWRSENDHRWIQELERLQKEREAQDARNDAQDSRLANLDQLQKDDWARMTVLEERLSAWRDEFSAESKKIKQAQLQTLRMQGQTLQDMLDELRGLLGEEET